MPRPTSLEGWWFKLLKKRAKGCVGLLAGLLGVSPRTLNKWGNGVHASGENLRNLRKLAGEELLADPICPKYIRIQPKVKRPS